jgi:PAS domain S-box-containing protein
MNLITGASEMAGKIREYPWQTTPLGALEDWSETLIAAVNLMLHSPFPTALTWGPEMVFLYNDAAIPTLMEKHPHSLGSPYRESFSEVWELVGPDFEACFYRGETSVREKLHVQGALRESYWNYSLVPVYENGKVAGIYDTYRNMTEVVEDAHKQREWEAELTLATETAEIDSRHFGELAAIVESSDDAIVSKTLNGTITSWNVAAERMFGYTAEEIIGQSILKLIPPDLRSDEEKIIGSIRSGRRVEHFETLRVTKEGRLLEVSLSVSPLKDEHGQIIGAAKILRDISDRKRMEQSLLQAEKIAATGRMAATIAHEINNPLEAVMNLLYLLRPMISDPEGMNYLNSAEVELGRVAHIAKQTLGYYREHALASRASLADIVRHAIVIYEPRCNAMGITIRQALLSERKVMLRRGEMMQVISNLIANSIYAMPTGGVLSMSVADTADAPDGIVLTIQDNGSGIAPEMLPKVFEAFFTTRAAVGTGIGLFVAEQFVEGHGGGITIESSTAAESHGTSMRIFLPIVTTYETPAATA